MHSTSSSENTPSAVTPLCPMPSSSCNCSRISYAAPQHATDIGAHLHVELARRLEAQHRVVARHVAHFKRRNRSRSAISCNHRIGQIPNLILRIQQHGNQRRALQPDTSPPARRSAPRARGEKMLIVQSYSCINSRAQASAAISISSLLCPRSGSSAISPLPDRLHCISSQRLDSADLGSISSIFRPPYSSSSPFRAILAAAIALSRTLAAPTRATLSMPHRNSFLAQLHRRLVIPVQPMRRGITPQQRSQRNPQLDIELLADKASPHFYCHQRRRRDIGLPASLAESVRSAISFIRVKVDDHNFLRNLR